MLNRYVALLLVSAYGGAEEAVSHAPSREIEDECWNLWGTSIQEADAEAHRLHSVVPSLRKRAMEILASREVFSGVGYFATEDETRSAASAFNAHAAERNLPVRVVVVRSFMFDHIEEEEQGFVNPWQLRVKYFSGGVSESVAIKVVTDFVEMSKR
jgi:hypothetical protein